MDPQRHLGKGEAEGLRRKRILWANRSMDDYETGMMGYRIQQRDIGEMVLGNRSFLPSSFTETGKWGFNGNGHGNETNVHFARIPLRRLISLLLSSFFFVSRSFL